MSSEPHILKTRVYYPETLPHVTSIQQLISCAILADMDVSITDRKRCLTSWPQPPTAAAWNEVVQVSISHLWICSIAVWLAELLLL